METGPGPDRLRRAPLGLGGRGPGGEGTKRQNALQPGKRLEGNSWTSLVGFLHPCFFFHPSLIDFLNETPYFHAQAQIPLLAAPHPNFIVIL